MEFITFFFCLTFNISSQIKSRNHNNKSSFLSSENKLVTGTKRTRRDSKDSGMKSYLKILRDKEMSKSNTLYPSIILVFLVKGIGAANTQSQTFNNAQSQAVNENEDRHSDPQSSSKGENIEGKDRSRTPLGVVNYSDGLNKRRKSSQVSLTIITIAPGLKIQNSFAVQT